VLESALVFAGDGLREVNLVAQAVVDRQPRRDAPGVLRVGEEALLSFRRVGGIAHVSGEGLHLAQQERGQREAAAELRFTVFYAGLPRSRGRFEGQLARTVRIARDAQILRISQVAAELEGMIPEGVRDVADPLELVLLLVQRAIAGVDAQRIPERKASSAVQSEGGHAGSIEVIKVQARNAGVLGGRSPQPVRIDKDPIAEEAEAEV